MSLEWNILNKLFPGRKVPRGRTESAVPPSGLHPCASFKGSAGIVVWRSVLTLRISPGWAAPFFDDENNKKLLQFRGFLNILYVTELPEAFFGIGGPS